MTSPSGIRTTLEKLIFLCERNLYIIPQNLRAEGATESRHPLITPLNGPCGLLLKQNVLSQWWHSMVTTSSMPAFPVTSFSNSDDKARENLPDRRLMSNTFSTNCLLLFPKILQFVNGRLPCALVKHGPHTVSNEMGLRNFMFSDSDAANISSTFEECANMTFVTVQYYVNPKTGLQLFNNMQRQRLAWWKKFSSFPANFHLTNVRTVDEESQLIEVQFQLPCGNMLTIEQLSNHGSKPVQQLSLSSDLGCQVKEGRKTIFPSVIECLMSIETAAFVFLLDAFREKKSLTDAVRLILTLHQRLTPYKVSVAIASGSASVSQLKDVANYIVKELRKNDVSVLFVSDLTTSSLESQFIRYDEMGIPYCIVLNEGTLKNGIIGVRNRDTTLKEQMHLSEIVSNITKYVSSY